MPFFIGKAQMKRRELLAAVSALSLSACASPVRMAVNVQWSGTVKPPRLRDGDTVGLFAPSGVLTEAGLAQRVKAIEGLGLKVKLAPNVLSRWGGYAGTPEQRVDDFMTLWRDGDVRALWALRGGSGASGMLPMLPYSELRANPKIVIGYSDITALHWALYKRAGLVSFHGPTAGSQFTPYTLANLRKPLWGERWQEPMLRAADHAQRAAAEPAFAAQVYAQGEAEGVLKGGNLSVLAAMAGGPYGPELLDFDQVLLFLEDVDEAPYRIDRMLTQLQLMDESGAALSRCAGLLLGIFNRCEAKAGDASLTRAEVMQHHAGLVAQRAKQRARSVPMAYGFSVGHVPSQMVLPFGVRARASATLLSLQLLESPVDA
jgi:muramoyltetrapeptide carboxypeptidase